MFHTSNFHKRHFELNFQRALIIVRKKESDDSVHKKYAISIIKKCTVNVEEF